MANKVKVQRKVLPNYPSDHKVGMVVPAGGSDCEKCEYWENGMCHQEIFVQWNGSGKIPTTPDRYCCDFFEEK